jgi:hypothetical protein
MNKKALPDGFTIAKSPIQGLGLFATEDLITMPTAVTHLHHPILGWTRTALGAFVNHSECPNCISTEDEVHIKTASAVEAFNLAWVLLGTRPNSNYSPVIKVRYLLARAPIWEGDEITLLYEDKTYHELS